MIGLYRTAWRAVTQNMPLYLVAAAGLVGTEVFAVATDAGGAGTLVAWFIVLYSFHRLLLLGENGRAKPSSQGPKQAMGRFLLVALLLAAIPFAVATGMLLRLWQGGLADGAGGVALVLAVLTCLIVYLAMLTLFGTALPAAAVRDRFGLGLTLSRARRTALGILGGMIIGPGLFGTLTLAALLLAAAALGPPPATYSPDAGLSPSGLLLGMAIQVLALFNATLSVAVLCRAYRKVVPPEIAALLVPEERAGARAPAQSPS